MFHDPIYKLPFLQFGEKPPEFRALPNTIPSADFIQPASDNLK